MFKPAQKTRRADFGAASGIRGNAGHINRVDYVKTAGQGGPSGTPKHPPNVPCASGDHTKGENHFP